MIKFEESFVLTLCIYLPVCMCVFLPQLTLLFVCVCVFLPQLPPAVLEQLCWIRRNPEDAEMMGAQALAASALRGAVGHDGDWPQEEEEVSGDQQVEEEQRAAVEEEVLEAQTTADQEEQKMEECATQEDQPG